LSDVEQRFHETWLGMLQPLEGLVVSIPVLVQAQCAERLIPDAQRRLFACCTIGEDGVASCGDLQRLLRELLGYSADALCETRLRVSRISFSFGSYRRV
jgi:hypothetical protein